jgi:glycosyltransferase involved in cell wall biosynthesis
MKVLLSALACEPDKGSEPEVGFRAMLAAAIEHEVWVLTLPTSCEMIERAIGGDPRRRRIHLVPIPFESNGRELDDLSSAAFHLGYDQWQRRAATRGIALDHDVSFDVVHHVTLASYWTRAGVAEVTKPLVWGPIGGGVDPPARLLPDLGVRGITEAVARMAGRPLIAMLPPVRKTQRLADVILVQNPDTGRRLHGSGHMRLLSNALAVDTDGLDNVGPRGTDVLFVGRLVPWKAPLLALRALRHVQNRDSILRFCGTGPEERRLREAARRWGLRDRVRYEGWLPRPKLLPMVAQAGVLIHPAVHEEAGLCIAEALSLGTPVVTLDHGGPSQIVGQYHGSLSALVAPRSPKATARGLAAAVDTFLREEVPPGARLHDRHASTSFSREILRAYELARSRRGP